MRKWFIFFLAVLLLAGCAPSAANQETIAVTGNTGTNCNGLTVTITEINSEELKVIWRNDTANEVIFGAGYFIERQQNGKWVSCALRDVAFPEIAYVLEAGTQQTMTYRLNGDYDISLGGKYRFRTECTLHDGEKTQHCNLWAEFEITAADTSETLAFDVQYIRTDGYHEGAEYPAVRIIRSAQELQDYYSDNKDVYDLGRRSQSAADSSIGFLNACDRYDDGFFKNNYLVFVLLEENSGSIRHEVTQVLRTAENRLSVDITSIIPEGGTRDMAQWHIILALEQGESIPQEAEVAVNVQPEERAAVHMSWADSPYQRPPELKVGGNTPAFQGTYSWNYSLDGVWYGICSDALHPLDSREFLQPITVTADTLELNFADTPDSVTVQCWPDSAWGDPSAQSEEVSVSETAIRLKPGGHIYMVSTVWNSGDRLFHGECIYSFYVVTVEE